MAISRSLAQLFCSKLLNIFNLIQYYTIRFNWVDMLNVNKKNYHVTRKIGIGLRILKRCSINRTQFIKYNWVQLHIRVYKLMNNEDKCLNITLWVKLRGQLIVKLIAIESRKNIFCYLSFYLHYSFFWQFAIVTFIYCIIKLLSQCKNF